MASGIGAIQPILRVVFPDMQYELPSLAKTDEEGKTNTPSQEQSKPTGRILCFITGLFVGSFLSSFTVFIMICVGILIDNHPLPEMLGAFTPQDFLLTVVKNIIRSILALARSPPSTQVEMKKKLQ